MPAGRSLSGNGSFCNNTPTRLKVARRPIPRVKSQKQKHRAALLTQRRRQSPEPQVSRRPLHTVRIPLHMHPQAVGCLVRWVELEDSSDFDSFHVAFNYMCPVERSAFTFQIQLRRPTDPMSTSTRNETKSAKRGLRHRTPKHVMGVDWHWMPPRGSRNSGRVCRYLVGYISGTNH